MRYRIVDASRLGAVAFHPTPWRNTAIFTFSAYLCGIRKGDRRDSNPRPSEPQSDDTYLLALPDVSETAYLSRFLCSRLPAVAACFALGGVRSGVDVGCSLDEE